MSTKLKTILTYGAILSLPMILMSVLAYVFETGQNKSFGWISVLVFAVTIFFIQRKYRDDFLKGFGSYGKVFGGTLLIIIVSGVIMFIYSFLFYKVIAPEQIAKMLEAVEVQLYEAEMPESQIRMAYEYNEKYIMTPISLSIIGFFTTFLQGLIINLISSFINRKKSDPFAEVMQEVDNDA